MANQDTLEQLIANGRYLLDGGDPSRTHAEFERWDGAVGRWLDKEAPGQALSAEWHSLDGSPLVVGNEYYSSGATWTLFNRAVRARLSWLGKLPQRLRPSVAGSPKSSSGRRVFVVHGHDDAARQSVARLIERLGLTAVILHEQPNRGRTIIEKFETFSDVAFAVVILTGDDIGRAVSATEQALRKRARQNVIFELGFFIGKLGRANVCALYSDGVELPSDYDGVVFVPLDSAEGWHYKLARELRSAGLPADLNALAG